MLEKFQNKLQELNQKKESKDMDFIYGVNEKTKGGFLGGFEEGLIERKKITLKEKAFFFSLFSVLLNAGITTIQSLKVLSNKTENIKFKRILNTIVYDVEKGESLSNAMEKFPEAFTGAEVGVVRSGEAIGALDRVMAKLAKQTEDQNKLLTQLKSSLTYPAIVFTILIGAVILMFGFVVPKLVELFLENGLELPTITKVMLFISQVLQDFWGLIIIAIILLLILASAYFNSEEGKFQYDLFKIKAPIMGPILKKVYIVRFMSTMALLVEAGVPLHQTIQIIADVIDNEVYRLKAYELKAAVSQGRKVSESLAETPFLFPETVSKVLEIGEQSAAIGEMSNKISNQYLGEVDYTLKNLTSVIGPIVIVLVGAFVAVFALAILSPVFQLTEGIV